MHFHLQLGSIILRDNQRHFTEESLEIIQTELPEVLLIKPKVFPDARGFFYESYRQDRLEQTGIAVINGTISCSRSVRATITINVGQQLGNSTPRTGSGKDMISCSTKTANRFAITVASTSSPGLSEGPATIKLLATGCDTKGCAKTTTSGDLQLVKKLK